jgi:hypothetical protein
MDVGLTLRSAQALRLTVAAQLEALRILIAKMSVSPGRIPALG